ncbi:MAG: hypothetical protein SH817_16065 [Leptospira sp.]|nr:hypothetical protein [Leptospira sp.]
MYKYSLFILLFLVSCSDNKEELIKEYGLGKLEFAKGNLEGSKKHFKKVHEADSSYEDVPLYLAKIEYYQGHFAIASSAFGKLLDDDTYGHQAHILKLKSDYAYRKDRSVLLKEIGDALKGDTSNLDLLIIAAKLNKELGHISQTILYYQRIINESDKIMLAHKELSKIYEKAGIAERVSYHTKKVEFWKEEKTNKAKEEKK